MSSPERQYHVYGTVKDVNGREVSRAAVTLWRQRIRGRVKLVAGRTDEDGRYRLSYEPPEEVPGQLLLVVAARSPKLETELVSQPSVAEPELQIDLEAQPSDRSELAGLLRAIEAQLDRLPLLEVVESQEHQDVSFLASETGHSTEEIMRVVVAARLEGQFEAPLAAFFAFLRMNVPATLPSPLLDASQGFTLIDPLVRQIGSLIFAVGSDLQQQTLQAAIDEERVGQQLHAQLPAILARFASLRTDDALGRPYLSGKTTLGQLLNATALPAAKQAAFAQALLENIKPLTDFWKELSDGTHGFTPTEVASVRRTIELGSLVKNQLPLVQLLTKQFAAGTYSSMHDLAKLTQQDWLNLINQAGPSAVPANMSPVPGSDPATTFARHIYDVVTRAYPTAALAARVATSNFVPPPARAPVAQFFANNATLELRRVNVEMFLEKEGEKALAGISQQDRPVAIAQVKRLQRVLRIVPHVDVAQTLLGIGIGSSAEIAMLGKQQLVDKLTRAGASPIEARKVFHLAQHRYASMVALLSQYNNGFIGVYPTASGPAAPFGDPIQGAIKRNPSLANLFGPQDVCAVDSCTSLLSPAAYLTDLLLWLRNRLQTGAFANALAALFDRRPDIGHLLLNCPNTETPLPYIDLVNELLEDAVSPPAMPIWKQTTRSAAELRAAPQYVNDAAYAVLASADYPHTLPYDRALDELRSYLQQSGVALWQLRESLQHVHGATPLAQAAAIAAERFGIGAHELNVIATPNFVPPATAWNTPTPVNDLGTAAAFMSAALITYEQLLELLDVQWVRGGGAPSALLGVDDTCDTTLQTITNLDAGRLDRMHRFLRLWRRTGWTMWELDLLLTAPSVGSGTLDQAALVALFTFRKLLDATGLSVDQLLAFFQDIDTNAHRAPDGTQTTSLYEQLFLNPAVPADPALVLATLTAPSPPAPAPPPLTAHMDAVRAALQIASGDVAALVNLTPDGKLTLSNLSLLYRVVTLAKHLKLSIADLLRIGPTPFTNVFASPSSAFAFVQRAAAIQQSGFTMEMLTYVLTAGATTVGISDTQVTTCLTHVRNVLQQVHDDIYGGTDLPLVVLQHELQQLPSFVGPPSQVDTAISIVNGTFAGSAAERTAFINTYFGLFMDATEIANALGAGAPADPQAVAQLVLVSLAIYLSQTRVISVVASDLHLSTDVAAVLIRQLGVPGTALQLIDALTDPSLIARAPGSTTVYAQEITQANFPNQYFSVRLIDKVGTVVRQLHLVSADVTWLLEIPTGLVTSNSTAIGGVDLSRLPVPGLGPQLPLSIDALLQTVLVVKLDRAFDHAASLATPPPVSSLFELIAGVRTGTLATNAAAQGALADITGWAAADIASLATALGVDLASNDYLKPAVYDDLRRLLAMGAATAGTGAQLVSWGGAVSDSVAETALQALKSRFGNDEWLQVAPKMMDPMRERRSTALAYWLVAQRDGAGKPIWGVDGDDLFSHFLLDVQMSSCEVTTRVIQAYAAVQLFVQQCLMNLERDVTVDLARDGSWAEWKWMQRYRIWEANRKVFLYPENWMVESQRPNRSELFQKLEQEVHQQENTIENLEGIALSYIDRLDEVAHLLVTGTCTDPRSGDVHVVARTMADPPRFYFRSFVQRQWTGWQQIPLDIKAHQAIPVLYGRRIFLFWVQVMMANEPQQQLPPAKASSSSTMSQPAARHVELSLDFSVFRNGAWAPAQRAKSKLYDIPPLAASAVSDSTAVEALYTLKTQISGSDLFLDVFRSSRHLARAVFDGRFNDVELRNLPVFINGQSTSLLTRAQQLYGPDAQSLLPLPENQADPDIVPEPQLIARSGALVTRPRRLIDPATIPLRFTAATPYEIVPGALLNTAPVPFRLVGPETDLNFDPTSPFFFADTKRSYFVETARWYQSGSGWTTVVPSYPQTAPFEVRYTFRRFYHPYTRLLWHELSAGGFPLLYDRRLQLNPDTFDPAHPDHFSFNATYHPVLPTAAATEDKEIIDFSRDAAYALYNWELFFHLPLYLAERLSQDQRFEDALTWFHYIFDPTSASTDPVPQRYWVTKPLNALNSAAVLAERINQLLKLVNSGDVNADAQVAQWRSDPFDPFHLADLRPVAYMKRVVMSYLDNLIAWADNLFATDSREALNEATLIYVLASEILGPKPAYVVPPKHLDASFDDLLPKLDAFANALVDIENVVPAGGGGGGRGGPPMPAPHTFFFKIPPNEKLLGYWSTVADRLFKLRHCQNIQGVTRQLALFDAPIDPGLLVRAHAAGVDIGSVLSDISASLPNYRFLVLYAQAQDFCGAVRAYGGQLLTALEKRDGDELAVLLATKAKELQQAADQIFAWKVTQAQIAIDAMNQTIALAQSKLDFYNSQSYMNAAEIIDVTLSGLVIVNNVIAAVLEGTGAVAHLVPNFMVGAAGFGGSPTATGGMGGRDAGQAATAAANAGKATAAAVEKGAMLARQQGMYLHRYDQWQQSGKEAKIQLDQANGQLEGLKLALQSAMQDQQNHQLQIDQIQQQLDFYSNRFSNTDLYDWMVGKLADTYFQSYRLAYAMAKRAERCYRYELGLLDSSFVTFGYWDSLKKGLLSGEALNHDLRRMQASYLDQNVRRYEISRFVSLVAIDPVAFLTLIKTGTCYFDLTEQLFDSDYPGHYQRRLTRVSVTVVYPSPGKSDNVKCTLTLLKNSVRLTADLSPGYAKTGPADPRFTDRFGAVQRIVTGNGQDDPGLFLTSISNNLSDQRYLPFEGAGAISSWQLDLPAANNEVDLTTVADVQLHLYYTALDGGDGFKHAAQAAIAPALPAAGVKAFSVQNDFPSAWTSFLNPAVAGSDQKLTLPITAPKFPGWTRGKTISIDTFQVYVISAAGGSFVLEPQAPLPVADVNLTPMAGAPNVATSASPIAVGAASAPGSWTLKLKASTAADWQSLNGSRIGDVLVVVNFTVS